MRVDSHNPQPGDDLNEIRHEAQRRFVADDFSDAWIGRMSSLIHERWSSSTEAEAEVLADIMAATPSSAWMREYLLPAERDQGVHAGLLVRRFDAIASAFAEGVARDDGLTSRA